MDDGVIQRLAGRSRHVCQHSTIWHAVPVRVMWSVGRARPSAITRTAVDAVRYHWRLSIAKLPICGRHYPACSSKGVARIRREGWDGTKLATDSRCWAYYSSRDSNFKVAFSSPFTSTPKSPTTSSSFTPLHSTSPTPPQTMAPPTSISSQKEQFLQSQMRLITAPLAPSPQWLARQATATADDPNTSTLSSKSISLALQQTDLAARRHHQLHYPTQATQHVAAQIEALYWEALLGASSSDSSSGIPPSIPVSADLTDPAVLAHLPEHWPSAPPTDKSEPEDDGGGSAQQQRYAELRDRLAAQQTQLAAAQTRTERYTALLALLDGFREPLKGVQENLLGRDCEVAKELDRMRVLMGRVGGMVQGIRDGDSGEREGEEVEERIEMPGVRDARRTRELTDGGFG